MGGPNQYRAILGAARDGNTRTASAMLELARDDLHPNMVMRCELEIRAAIARRIVE